MYETESNSKVESVNQLSGEVISAFKELTGKVSARTVLPWSEHCTECVWPTCYSTCDLYSPREDGRCRRFTDGMVRIECPEASNSYLLKIRFKQWGKLWAPASIRLHPIDKALKLEQRDHRIGSTLYQISLPTSIKTTLVNKRYSYKKRVASRPGDSDRLPTSFLLECYNPESHNVRLSLTMRSVDERVKIPFQKLFDLNPGFHRLRVGLEEITKRLDVRHPFTVELIPNDDETETTLYFGLMEFVEEAPQPSEKAKKLKCVVWDLDNTLWDGILVEDGPSKLRLKAGIVGIIEALDGRGILHSIASKNNRDETLQVLKDLQIDQYFLCPQISWQPKSEGIKAIAEQLNIGRDTLLFIDDTDFELEQVKSTCPDVQVLNAREYQTLLQMNEFQVPVTEESRNRRKMYQLESTRQDLAAQFGDDYMAFLKDCNIRLNIRPMTEDNLQRVHELTQRTNQMNFSGNRYDREVLKVIISTPYLDTYVLDCEDRFGSYGVVGFSIVDSREPRMTDLMFSCRIQSKRVEHAFLGHIAQKYITESGRDFYANYRRTPRNAPSGKVFDDLGMETASIKDGVSSLVFSKDREVPDDEIVHIVVHAQSHPALTR
jgi:FkbH-like protein